MLPKKERNFVDVGVKAYHFKAKDSELNKCPLCPANISKDFAFDNMKETGLNGYDFSVDYYSIDVDGILDLKKCLMKKII